jgi:metal-responsive CopG/Arc/MetJ family transcriptional regulator
MEKLKQISVRIDPVTLQKIDDFCKKHYYWKRNTVINGLLGAIVDGMDDKTLYDMVRYSRNFYEKPKGTFYIPEKLPI